MEDFILRWKNVFVRISMIPTVFLGIGLYRAWLATFFRYDAFQTIGFIDYALFEIAIGATSLLVAFSARRIVPLWSHRLIVSFTFLTMTTGSVLCVIANFFFNSAALNYIGLVLAGIGLAILILIWAEFYGSLNPMRVALYHAAGIFVGELIKWVFTGMDAAYIAVFTVILPACSISWAIKSLKSLPEVDRPRRMQKSNQPVVPWKPIALMATCTFATGFGTFPEQPLLAGNMVGTMFVTAFVFFGVLSASKWINFDTIYQMAFPFMIVGLLLIAPAFSTNPEIVAACYDAGYTMLSMFIMIILSNITYRFGISAAWLNGIERGIRYLIEVAGWSVFAFANIHLSAQYNMVFHSIITVAVIIAFVSIFFTEKHLSSKWGINLHEEADNDDVFSPGRTAMRVSDISRKYNLSPREEEVLQLLARKKPTAEIESDLFVAEGTVKAHTSRIYRKLSVHSRHDLYDMLGVPDEK